MELVRFPSRGGFSVRSIFTFVLAVVVTVVLTAIFVSTTSVSAAPNANWSGDSIIYDTHGYAEAKDFSDPTGTIPAGSSVYTSPVQANGSTQRILILYFSPGVDPPTATSVNYVEFDYSGGALSNPQGATTVNLTQKGHEDPISSCSVEGVGWLLCPMSIFLANGMDWLFGILSSLIAVKPPVLGDANNSMFVVWNIARGIANIAFVLVFLIIIYAQITNFQISNYGIKRLLPRLVVAAVLVNLSFYIAALAIDISNILGYSIQDIFKSIRESVFSMTNDSYASPDLMTNTTWASITSVILAGGGVIGGLYYVSEGGLFLLIPLLVGLALTVLFVVIILAARQAIILLLVIISPLAFVANLLPNTEKWFDKWKDLFFTMLIFFPAFSLVFGGSQLAGQIIMQNAGDNIVMLLFGLAVQVAPLVITPLILKLSGGLLGKIAQITNDPRKGLIDRNKDWAKRRAEYTRQNNISRGVRGNPASWGAGLVRSSEFRRRRLADKTEAAKQEATNRYNQTAGYEKIHFRSFEAEVEKHIIEDGHKRHIQHEINRVGSTLHLQNARLETGKRALEATVKITEATIKEYDAGRVPVGASPELRSLIGQMHDARRTSAVESMRASAADAQIQREFAEALKGSVELRRRAGGIKPLGADSVLASAVSAVRKADAEDIKNIQDASDLKPGDLPGAAAEMVAAIKAGNSIRARAFQNMLVTAGGAGMEQFRKTMLDLGNDIPADVSEAMRDNMLSNHAALKAKSNDLITWASKGGALAESTYTASTWQGLSDNDFIAQHPKTQIHALKTNPFTKERAQRILAADVIAGNILTEEIKEKLREIE